MWFEKRGFPQNMINTEIGRVKFGENKQNRNKSAKGIPFVVMYNPMLEALGKILHDNINLLHMSSEVRRNFTLGPMISLRTPRKMSSYLDRGKLYPLKRIVGSIKCCKKRCEVCEKINNSDNFTSSATGEDYKINH